MSNFIDKESKFEGGFSKNVLDTLWQAYRKFLIPIFMTIIFGFVGRLFLLGNANIIGYWVDSFCKPETANCSPLPFGLGSWSSQDFVSTLLIITVLGFLLTMTFRIVFSRLSAYAVSQIYDEVTFRASRFPIKFFDTNPAGRIITRFSSDYGNVFRLFGGPLAEFIAIVFDIIGMILLVTLASPYYLIPVSVIILLNYVTFKLNQKALRESRRSLSFSRSPSIAHFAETTQGAASIRSFGKQTNFSRRFDDLDNHFLNQKIKTSVRVLSYSLQMNILTAVLLLLTGFGAIYLVQQGLASVGSVGVAFGFIVLSGGTVQMFFEWLSQLEEAMVGMERLDHYLRLPTEPGNLLPTQARFKTGHEQEVVHSEPIDQVKNRALPVSFEDVWLSYSQDNNFVIKGMSLELEAGKVYGIIGRTGSGKSSLIQALFGFYPIQKGTIRINGKTAADMGLSKFRSKMSLIPQDPSLFRGTVKDNLDITGLIPDEKLYQVLRKVGLREWATPEGLRIPIEERGRNLSVGEKQLICLGRSLLQDAEIVVMDEATASVDPQSEEIMLKATEDFFAGKTQIIIAHRLTTLERCDQVIWIEKGQVRMQGPPDQVLSLFERTNLSL